MHRSAGVPPAGPQASRACVPGGRGKRASRAPHAHPPGGEDAARPAVETAALRQCVFAPNNEFLGSATSSASGERFTGVHIHLYHEGLGDRVAYLPEDLGSFLVPPSPHDLEWFTAFLTFCNIIDRPDIQSGI
jgi:hypothetical protein